MELRNLWNDDDAVSPVIGVILMVAITVILAAVIATFVLGLGEQVSSTGPQAQFTFDYNEDPGGSATIDLGPGSVGSDQALLTITHAGGDTITASQLSVSGSSVSSANGDWNEGGYEANSEISAGDSLNIVIESDDTISVTWTSENGQTSSTLRQWSGPDA